MKVSFILPVYKVESYLRQCVESITCQTYRDIEIILVDDGSPDNCPVLCDQLATEDERIRVVHKPNGGLSDARNAGMKVASGDYVVFVDSDDWWDDDNCLMQLVTELEKTPSIDFLGFNFKKKFEGTGKIVFAPAYSEATLSASDSSECLYALAKQGVFPISACTKLIRREFLIEHNLFFIKGLISEDIPWFIELISASKKCRFVNMYVYNYRQERVGSITNSFSEKKFNDRIGIIKSESAKVEGRDLTEKGKKGLYCFLAYEYTQFINGINRFEGAKQKEVIADLNKYRWLLKYSLNYKVAIPRVMCALGGLHNTARLVRLFRQLRK